MSLYYRLDESDYKFKEESIEDIMSVFQKYFIRRQD